MKTLYQYSIFCLSFASVVVSGCAGPKIADNPDPLRVHAGQLVIDAAPGATKPPFAFHPDDDTLLEEIGHATFAYFWNSVCPQTGMVYDRSSSDTVSTAGVGFQLAALVIGAERGWVSREDAEDRTLKIVRALDAEPTNRKAGLFYHFINPGDATPRRLGAELTVSTIDSALLFSGLLAAGQYFGGETAQTADRLFADADWTFFLVTPEPDRMPDQRFISLGWKPLSDDEPTGTGKLIPYSWIDSGDEHRLVTFLAVCAPNPEHRVDPSVYWNLRRRIGWHEGIGHFVWLPYSGSLFTAFFAHCFINSATLGLDNPSAAGVEHRARVDWWENSRRTVLMHRAMAIANPHGFPTLGPDAWGLSACDGPTGYIVPGLFPERVEMIGAEPGKDYSTYEPEQKWDGGVVAPYAAGASIMFTPAQSLRALRNYRELRDPSGGLGVWQGGPPKGPGFADAFTLDEGGFVNWVATDHLAIDQGPMLVGIENARSGLIWQLFMGHGTVRAGLERLGLSENSAPDQSPP